MTDRQDKIEVRGTGFVLALDNHEKVFSEGRPARSEDFLQEEQVHWDRYSDEDDSY